MNKHKQKRIKRTRRHNRVRSKILGTAVRPRLSVFRSGKHIYAQVIDDATGQTLASASSLKFKVRGKKADSAKKIGQAVALAALSKNIQRVVFDRGGYKYHGRVKALADGAREGGLNF